MLHTLTTVITNNANHAPETWADMCVEKLVHVSDTAPQPIRDQALAYKEKLREIIHYYIREAVLATEAEMITKFAPKDK